MTLIIGNDQTNALYGTVGEDTIAGLGGGDYLEGRGGNDVLNAGDGNDDLSGGDGNDLLNGDAGDDELNGGVGNDTADGGSGTDSYNNDYSSRTTGLSMSFSSATGNGTIVVGAETDTLISIEKFYDFKGTNFDDTIVGAIGSDLYLRGLAGNDLISGNAGGDWIYGGDGNDTIDGGADNDYLYGETGNDILEPGLGRDYADGGTDIDILKIDTEGHDFCVLKGFSNFLQKAKIKVIQFEYGKTCIPPRITLGDFYNLLEPLGYSIGRLYPNQVKFQEYNLFRDEHFRMGNYVAVHRNYSDLIKLIS